MVKTLALALLGLAVIGRAVDAEDAPVAEPSRAVGRAMSKVEFPWYDAPKDEIRPIQVPLDSDWWTKRLGKSSTSNSSASRGGWDLGSWIAFTAFALGLAILIGLLAYFWRLYKPAADADLDELRGLQGQATRTEELPAGLRLGYDPSDPWSEAIRRRDRGDLAGAIVCVFAYQLLTLSRLGLVRLAPGRTGRQLLRSVSDLEFRGLVAPTLRLFEAAYYGHHAPSVDEFNLAWAAAETFQRRVASGVSP